MPRKKQADVDRPLETWSVHNGVINIMGMTITAALAFQPSVRDLKVVELWSGVGAIVAAAEKYNYKTAAFDLNRLPGVTDMPGEHCEDITMLKGFLKAISLVLRLEEGGFLALAPDCSSFTFPNSSRHKRLYGEAHGDLLYHPVNVGNLMAVIALFLCQLALTRQVHFALENPPHSHIFRFFLSVCPQFMYMVCPDFLGDIPRTVQISRLCAQTVHRCPYDDSPEPKLQKVYKWVATWHGIMNLNARCTCNEPHRRLGRTCGGRWSGNLKLLAESAAYPKRLGEALLDSWRHNNDPISISWSRQALEWEWLDPRTAVECSEAPALKKATTTSRSQEVQTSEFGPGGSIQQNIVE